MIFKDVQGERVPSLGFGTYRLQGTECEEGVADALEIGYRHIDTAQSYDNEAEVGRAIAAAGLPRSDLFVVSKVRPSNYGEGTTRDSVMVSLEKLGLDFVDLMLLHWPKDEVSHAAALTDLAAMQGEGLVKHVGVSNFPTALVEEASEVTRLFCNQVEYHPFLSQLRIIEQAAEQDILVTAYRPLAGGSAAESPLLKKLGAKYGKSANQVALRWLIQQPHVATIPKSGDAARRRLNFDLFDFELTADEVSAVHALASGKRLVAPDDGPAWDS